ncbi:MAG: hypothetical protein V2B20_07270 [Pseudomonadota bacterium]
MNHQELSKSLEKLKANDSLKQKLKIFLGIGCAGCLLVVCLLIWAGVSTVKHVAGLATSPGVQEQITNLKAEIPKLPALAKVGCLEKVKSLLTVQVWLEQPVADTLSSVTEACFGKKTGALSGKGE